MSQLNAAEEAKRIFAQASKTAASGWSAIQQKVGSLLPQAPIKPKQNTSWASLQQKVNSSLPPVKSKVSNAVSQTGNSLNYNFWHSPVGQGLVNTQKFIESAKPTQIVPNFKPFSDKSLTGQVGNSVANIPGGIINTVVGQGVIDPALDIGRLAGARLTGQNIPSYSTLKSPQARLAYNVMGEQRTPQQIAGNLAGTALPPLSVYGGGKVFGFGSQAAEQAAKTTFLNSVKSGAISGSKIGGIYGLINGLAEGRNDSLPDQVIKSLEQGAGGAVAGGLLSGGLSGTGHTFGAVKNKLSDVLQKDHGMSKKQADQAVLRFARDELGRFTGKRISVDEVLDIPNMLAQSAKAGVPETKYSKLYSPARGRLYNKPSVRVQEPKFYGDLRETLHLPRNGDYQAGFINFDANIGPDDLHQLERGGNMPAKQMNFSETPGILNKLRDSLTDAKSAQDEGKIINEFVDATLQNPSETNLKATRAALNRELVDTAGEQGHYKGNYAAIQALKDSPVIGQRITTIQEGIARIDEQINKPAQINPSVDLRSSGRNAATNIRAIDNPLYGEEGAKRLAQYTKEKNKWSPENFQMPDFLDEVSKVQKAIENPLQTPVKKKINIIDYIRTPEHVMKKIGMEKEMTLLRRKWEDYNNELPEELNRVTEWSKRAPNENREIFQWLDGNKGVTLSSEGKKVAEEIQTYFKDWADRLKLPDDKRLSNYITHIFESDFINKEFDEDLAKIITDKIPSQTYDPFLQKRLGKLGYKMDAWGALDAYVKRAVRKFHIDQALEPIERKSESLELSQLKYVKRYVENVNMRPQEIETLIDNTVKSSPIGYKLTARPVTFASQKIRQAFFRGMIGLNPASAIRNLGQGANTYAKLGEKYTPLGYIKLLTNGTKELKEQGVLDDSFIQDRNLSAYKNLTEKMDKGLFSMFNLAETINRGAAYYGGKAKALSQGMNEAEAIDYAKKIVRDTQFLFSRVDTPVALQSDAIKTLFQFANYPVKQTEFLSGMVKNKDVAGLVRWTGASLLYAGLLSKAFGIKYDFLPNIGSSPIVQTGQAVGNTAAGYLSGDEEKTSQGINDLSRLGVSAAIPGGNQLHRTGEAALAMQEGGSFTKSGNLKFEVPPSVKPLIFGLWSTQEAQDYLNKKKGQALSPEEQEAQKYKEEFNQQKADAQKVSNKMYLQLKDLQSPEERLALIKVWKQQGLWDEKTREHIKDMLNKQQYANEGNYAKAVRNLGTNQARAYYLAKIFSFKSVEERKEILRQLRQSELWSEDLREKLLNLKREN